MRLDCLVTVIIFFFGTANTCAQVSDSVYHQRLFYVCKAWGHLKYYHSEVAKGKINWDNELLGIIPYAKSIIDDSEFGDSLFALVSRPGETQLPLTNPIQVPDSLNNNLDTQWIHSRFFPKRTSAILDTISSRFRPQSNIYLGRAFFDGPPTFDNDQQYYAGSSHPAEMYRILALFRYWNIIHYFYPYKSIIGRNWDSILAEFIPLISAAKDARTYHLNLKALTAKINDSHAFFSSSVYTSWNGSYAPPFTLKYVENETVIASVLPTIKNIRVGDIIKEVDGVKIHQLRDSLRKYVHGSNEETIDRNLNEMIFWGPFGTSTMKGDSGSGEFIVSFLRNSTNYSNLQLLKNKKTWWDTTLSSGCSVGIVDMGLLETFEVSEMMADFWNKDMLIFDIRNYPNGTLWYLIDYLYKGPIHIANFMVPDTSYPGTFHWSYETIGTGTNNAYSGKIIILFNEETQSQAEYTCMGLEQFPDVLKIGSTTAGADGNVTKVYLPGIISTYFTGLGTYYPDYSGTQRIGIVPDISVVPTITGIRAGRDEIMERALNCSPTSIRLHSESRFIQIYPNPTSNSLEITSTQAITRITIREINGKAVSDNPMAGLVLARLDVSDLVKGLYYVEVYSEGKKYVETLVINK